MKSINWRVVINSAKRRNANKVQQTLFKELSHCEVTSFEIYWKDPKFHMLEFYQLLNPRDEKDILVQVMEEIKWVSNHWQVDIPEHFGQDEQAISGMTNSKINVTGVTWASFTIEETTEMEA